MSLQVTLRYFDLKGRAQPLRNALLEASHRGDLGFEDVRLPVPRPGPRVEDPSIWGPFNCLPTLSWGDTLLGETLPIASFLSRELGFDAGLGSERRAYFESIVSCSYLDVMLPLGMLLWSELAYPGSRVEQSAQGTLPRALAKLGRLEALVPAEGYLGGAQPNLADYFLLEAYEAVLQLVGTQRSSTLAARVPQLAALAQRLRERPALTAEWSRRPARMTGSPQEPSVLERIWATDLPGF